MSEMAQESKPAASPAKASGRRFPVAQDAFPYLAVGAVLTLAASWAGWFAVAWPLGLLTAFVAFFFRDPERRPPSDPDALVSPADGKVVQIRREEGGETRVSIFLSVFNVHINRSPIRGRVLSTEYREGKFLAAFRHDASTENEQNTIRILSDAETEDAGSEVRVRQIAGAVARRIVCWTSPGEHLQVGERLGLIKFGSRVDLFLPPHARVIVGEGDRVRGGADVIARWEKTVEP